MKNPAKNKTEQKRLRSSSVSNQSRFFSSTLTSTLTSSTANRNVKKVYTFESLDIIERPEKYIKKYAETSSAIKYLLMLHSDRIEVIEFLLFNEAAKQFEPTDLSKFDNSCKRIFPQLASSIVREMASSANTSEVEHAKRIASKFCELKYRVHLRHLKIDHNNKTLSDFYKSIADGNTPAHPFCDSKAQLELKYDFFVSAMIESEHFCLLIATTPALNPFIEQYEPAFFSLKNLALTNKLFEKLHTIDPSKTFNSNLIKILKNIFLSYIKTYKTLPDLIFSDNIFWKIIKTYSEDDKKTLAETMNKNHLADTAMKNMMRKIKKPNALSALESGFLKDLSAFCNQKTRKLLVSTLLRFEDPKVDALSCKIPEYRKSVEQLNQPKAWNNMLTRLTRWFDYDALITDSAHSRQVTSSQDLITSNQGKIIQLQKSIFLSSPQAFHLTLMIASNKLCKTKSKWISAHRSLIDIISNRFKPQMHTYLNEISEIHGSYEEVLILKLVKQEEDRFNPTHYNPKKLPAAIQNHLTKDDKKDINEKLKAMKKYWSKIKKREAFLKELNEKEGKQESIPGFSSISTVIESVLTSHYQKETKRGKMGYIKMLEQNFSDLLGTINQEDLIILKKGCLKDLKPNEPPAFINDAYKSAFTALLEESIFFNEQSKSLQVDTNKLINALKGFLSDISKSEEHEEPSQCNTSFNN